MASQVIRLGLLIGLLYNVNGGDVTVTFSPASLRFGNGGPLRASNLDDVLTASLGYTPGFAPWKGLTVASPFGLPSAAVVVGVHTGGATLRQEGVSYDLKEDKSLNDVFTDVKSIVGTRAQRPTVFDYISLDDSSASEGIIPTSQALTTEKDAPFLQEMAALLFQAQRVEANSSVASGGQDIFFFEVNSLGPLVQQYGIESQQVSEALAIMRNQLTHLTEHFKKQYNNEVLVIVATIDDLEVVSRQTRQILQSEELNINEATLYSEDYPVVFNIILWMSIVLLLTILAISVAMGTMDPGQDSIIYRMTNPRMKKDN